MGTCTSSDRKVDPQFNIVDNRSPKDEEIVQIHRRTTDTIFFTLHAIALVGLIFLLLYCVFNGNIYRIISGYDNCKNICGRKNDITYSHNSTCVSQNMKDKPFILVFMPESRESPGVANVSEDLKRIIPDLFNDRVHRICLENCSSISYYKQILNRCIPDKTKGASSDILGKTGISDFFEEVTEDFEICWPEILYLCLISLAFSFLIIILLKLLVGIMVWLVLITVIGASLAGTVYLWLLWKDPQKFSSYSSDVGERKSSYLAFAILASIATVCIFLVILVMRKQIKLVIQLFKEAGKAMTAMPLLLFQPVVTFICVLISISCWIYFSLWIESAGQEKEISDNFYVYEKDFWVHFTRWYNILIFLWMMQFCIGCQHMVIAGAVCSWYFTRNKASLDKPIFHGLYNLLRYHLGSVSLGSLIIAIVQLARIALSIIQKYSTESNGNCANCLMKCCRCCLYCLENILKFITRNAYIEIAIHGYSFCKAGQRAFKILLSNAFRVTAINSVGDFVLFLSKVLVIVATVLVGIQLLKEKQGVLHVWVPLTLSGVFAYLISHCFLSVYEMTIDTIFICFCEDCENNDGISKSYFMSKELMEFVENSKSSMPIASVKKEAWQNKPSTISSSALE